MKRKSRLHRVRTINVKGILMSMKEYRDFVKYLNLHRVQKFTKDDVSRFIESRMFR